MRSFSSLRTLIGCRLDNQSARIYLRQTKLTLQLWTENGFILSLSHKILEPPFCKIFASLLYRLHVFSSKLSRSCARKFVLSIQIIVFKRLHFNSPPFVYYRGEWRADLSVSMEISAREERISFIKCRLPYILEHPF